MHLRTPRPRYYPHCARLAIKCVPCAACCPVQVLEGYMLLGAGPALAPYQPEIAAALAAASSGGLCPHFIYLFMDACICSKGNGFFGRQMCSTSPLSN